MTNLRSHGKIGVMNTISLKFKTIIFSAVFTLIILAFGFSTVRKNTFLTYISIVDIKGANINEKAFLNFRTNESGDYSFDFSNDSYSCYLHGSGGGGCIHSTLYD